MTDAGPGRPVRPRRPVRYTDPREGVNIEAAEDRRRFLDALALERRVVLADLFNVLPLYQKAVRRVAPLVTRPYRRAWRRGLPDEVQRSLALIRAHYREAQGRRRADLAWRVLHHVLAGDPDAALIWVRPTVSAERWSAAGRAFEALRDALDAWAARFGLDARWLTLHALATLRDWAANPRRVNTWAPLDSPPVSPAPEGAPEALHAFFRLPDADARRQLRALRARAREAADAAGWQPITERRGKGARRDPIDGFRALARYQTDPTETFHGLAGRLRVDRHHLVLALRKAAAHVGLTLRPSGRVSKFGRHRP